MSKPGNSKQKDVISKQTVMGDFFSKTDKSKKSNKKVDSSAEKGSDTKRNSLKRKVTGAGMFGFSWTRGSHRDTECYRNGYPGQTDNPDLNDNFLFYTGKISSKPDGDYIDKIHTEWWGNYKLLEVHHGYIQWLFPIRESGLNWHAQELQLHEIEKLQKNRTAMKRLLTSYKMMLDFYGMALHNEQDGTLVRGEKWKDRFQHLNRSYHNYLRITRILKCLGEFGFEHLKKNFVKFILEEGLQKGTLSNLIDSCVKYWIGVLRDDGERYEVFDYYEELLNEEQLTCKKKNKSPSVESKSLWKTNEATGKKTISKPENKKSKEKQIEDEFSDDEDDSLYYAMNLIDSDNDESTRKRNDRKDHEMSDSDVDTEESQEMSYWNNDQKSDEKKLKGNVESSRGTEDFNQEENKTDSSKSRNVKSPNLKEENRANSHELEMGSDIYSSLTDTSEENKGTDSTNKNDDDNGKLNSTVQNDTNFTISDNNENNIRCGPDTGNANTNHNTQTENPKYAAADELIGEDSDKIDDLSKVQDMRRGLYEENKHGTETGNADTMEVNDDKTENVTAQDELSNETDDIVKPDGTVDMETL